MYNDILYHIIIHYTSYTTKTQSNTIVRYHNIKTTPVLEAARQPRGKARARKGAAGEAPVVQGVGRFRLELATNS